MFVFCLLNVTSETDDSDFNVTNVRSWCVQQPPKHTTTTKKQERKQKNKTKTHSVFLCTGIYRRVPKQLIFARQKVTKI